MDEHREVPPPANPPRRQRRGQLFLVGVVAIAVAVLVVVVVANLG